MPQGFRKPEAPAASKNKADRCLQIDLVSHRNENGLNLWLRSYSSANFFVLIEEGRGCSFVIRRHLTGSHQGRLGAAKGGLVQEVSQVAGQAEASGVSDPLGVKKKHIGRALDLREELKQNRPFAEGQ